jgi:hypothetical protein
VESRHDNWAQIRSAGLYELVSKRVIVRERSEWVLAAPGFGALSAASRGTWFFAFPPLFYETLLIPAPRAAIAPFAMAITMLSALSLQFTWLA